MLLWQFIVFLPGIDGKKILNLSVSLDDCNHAVFLAMTWKIFNTADLISQTS